MWCWISSYWCTNIWLKNLVIKSEKAFFMRKDSIDKSLFREVSSSSSLRSPIDFFKKLVHFLSLDLRTKLRASQSTFMRILRGMVVYKVLKSKAEIDFSFFLTLNLFSLVTNAKEFCTTQNILLYFIRNRLYAAVFLNIFYYFFM